ncbi:MAG: hypothetical protein WCA13_03545 [Terriglobales bacterium]
MTKGLGLLLFPVLVIVLMLGGTASAQNVGDNSAYFVTYFSNANTTGAADEVLRIVNDGDASTSEIEGVPNGTLWASLYVLDDGQILQECCNCEVTADGLLSESVDKQLTSNTLTGRLETSRGIVKVISSATNDPTNNTLAPGLRGTMTHIQATSNIPETGPFFVTEAPLADSNLSSAEKTALEQSCAFTFTLGRGYGTCSCTPEDQDF